MRNTGAFGITVCLPIVILPIVSHDCCGVREERVREDACSRECSLQCRGLRACGDARERRWCERCKPLARCVPAGMLGENGRAGRHCDRMVGVLACCRTKIAPRLVELYST